jgi:hypothetical protein
MRIAIRGYIAGRIQFEDYSDIVNNSLHDLSELYTARLLSLPGGDSHMIAIEFLDEPDPHERWFRFGTDKGALPPKP